MGASSRFWGLLRVLLVERVARNSFMLRQFTANLVVILRHFNSSDKMTFFRF